MKNKRNNRGGYKSKTDWGSIKIVLMFASFGALLIAGLGGSFFFGEFDVKYVEASEIPEQTIIEYIITETKEAGMNLNDVVKIISCESGFKTDVVVIEPNKSLSYGIWQINSVHKDISNADKLDYKKATDYAIKLWQKQGWAPWSCAAKLGIK